MPTYKIDGIDRETGENRTITFEATDSDHAANIAADQGVMVADIFPVKPSSNQLAGYHPKPDYGAMKILGGILFWFGFVSLILASVIGIPTLLISILFPVMGLFLVLPTLAGCFAISLLLMATGQLLYAVRDIARNSWRS